VIIPLATQGAAWPAHRPRAQRHADRRRRRCGRRFQPVQIWRAELFVLVSGPPKLRVRLTRGRCNGAGRWPSPPGGCCTFAARRMRSVPCAHRSG